MRISRQFCLLILVFFAVSGTAAESTAGNLPSTATAGILQSLVGLLVVLAVIVGLAWMARRFPGRALGSTQHLKVISQLAVGAKERVSLIELADTWVLIGVTPTQLSTLHVMPKSETAGNAAHPSPQPFASLLEMIRSGKPNA